MPAGDEHTEVAWDASTASAVEGIGSEAPAIARLRRALYLGLLPLLAVATLVTGLLGAPGSYDRMVLPMVSAVMLVIMLAVYQRWISYAHLEKTLFVLFTLVYLGKLATGLAPGPTLDQVFVWTPLLYVLAFLLFEPRQALAASVVALGLSIGITAVRIGGSGVPVRSMFEFYLAISLLIAMVYGLSRLRRDVAALQTQLVGMRRLANQDVLTVLPNRRALESALERILALGERTGQPAAVILFDLDDFKRVNDVFGHDAGDEVLKGVAERGEEVLRRPDTFGRWGGEEFLVITPGIDLPGAMRVAERMRTAIGGASFGRMGRVTASFGVTAFRPGDTVEAMVKRADDALYLAKQAGKDRVEALVREIVQHVTLPSLLRPYLPPVRSVETVQRGTLEWLKDHRVAPPETLYRWVDAVEPGWLAAHIHIDLEPQALQIVSDWAFWMFLHDDHCDTSEAGSHPRYLIDLHQRLLSVLAGAAPDARDGALAELLADLRRRLSIYVDDAGLQRFMEATDRYFAATRWEAANRASGTTPDLETYERMRLLTSGLHIDTVLSQLLDGVPRCDVPLAQSLYAAADRAVCWANDIFSLNKEVQEQDVHNLVLALQAADRLGLDAALAKAARMHDDQVERFRALRATIESHEGTERASLEAIAAALEARIAANVAWSERCSRYRSMVTVHVGSAQQRVTVAQPT